MKLVAQNIEHARSYCNDGSFQVDVYLAHYDMNRTGWETALGAPWYRANVQHSAMVPGLVKAWLARDLLLLRQREQFPEVDYGGSPLSEEQLASLPRPDIYDYEYIWLLDQDAEFTATTDLRAMLQIAQESQAGVVEPAYHTKTFGPVAGASGPSGVEAPLAAAPQERRAAMLELGEGTACQPGEVGCDFQEPHACRYRYVNWIEVSFPLLRPAVLDAVMGRCRACMPNRASDWELDRVWCALAQKVLDTKPGRSCAIVDSTPMVHRNTRSLPRYEDQEKAALKDMEDLKTRESVKASLAPFRCKMPVTHACVA